MKCTQDNWRNITVQVQVESDKDRLHEFRVSRVKC